jgi:peroxiredoxin
MTELNLTPEFDPARRLSLDAERGKQHDGHVRIIPGEMLPALDARLLSGERWTIASETPERLALLAFYRGIFCPICRTWVADLDQMAPEFAKRGISTVVLSADEKEGAEKAVKDWDLKNLRVAYGVNLADARRAGLYVSEGRGLNAASGLKESRLFTEPALLLVKPDGELYAAWVQSTPFARVHVAEILTAADNYIAKDIPRARGAA